MKYKSILTLKIIMLWVINLHAQNPNIEWQKCFGGSQTDFLNKVIECNDGNFIGVGYSNSNDFDVSGNHGGIDYWLLKFDSAGNVLWQKCYGGSLDEEAYSLFETKDSGFILGGYSLSSDGNLSQNHGSADYWVIKVNDSGTIQWQKSLGGSQIDWCNDVIQTFEGNYVAAGWSNSNDADVPSNSGNTDFWIIKLDSSGGTIWSKCFGGSGHDDAYSLIQTSDSGFLVVGQTDSDDGDITFNHGGNDVWVIKINKDGILEWQKTYGGSGTFESANVIKKVSWGGYLIGGNTNSSDGDATGGGLHANGFYDDGWLIKINESGNIEWQHCYGGLTADAIYGLNIYSDFSIYSSGRLNYNGPPKAWAFKTDSSGNVLWDESFGNSGGTGAYDVFPSNGGYLVPSSAAENGTDVSGCFGNGDFWLVKLRSTTAINNLCDNDDLIIYPNPTHELLFISGNQHCEGEISIVNLLGQEIFTSNLQSGSVNLSIDLSHFVDGTYIVEIKTINSFIFREKLIIQ